MSTATETIAVAELEEMFANEVPCGGNRAPVARPCPHDAPAAWVNVICKCDRPSQFKCDVCYGEWFAYASLFVYCVTCSMRSRASEAYRPL